MEAKSHSHRNNSIGEEPPSCQSIETHSKNIHLNDSNWYKDKHNRDITQT